MMATDPHDIRVFSLGDLSATAWAAITMLATLIGWAAKGALVRRRLRREDEEDAEKRVRAAVERVKSEMAEKAELGKTIDGLRNDMRAFSSETRNELAAIRLSQAAHDDTLRMTKANAQSIQRMRERISILEERVGVAPRTRREDD